MSSPVRDALRFERVDIVFGRKPEAAFPLIDAGLDPAAITVETGLTVGAMQASFSVREGECLVQETAKPGLHDVRHECSCIWENLEPDALPEQDKPA